MAGSRFVVKEKFFFKIEYFGYISLLIGEIQLRANGLNK